MNGIVIDASVTLSWCFPDEQTPMSLDVLDRLSSGEQALALRSGCPLATLDHPQRQAARDLGVHCL